jgi:hypothetical protein
MLIFEIEDHLCNSTFRMVKLTNLHGKVRTQVYMVGLVLKEIGLPTYFVSICSSQNLECLVSLGKEITHQRKL